MGFEPMQWAGIAAVVALGALRVLGGDRNRGSCDIELGNDSADTNDPAVRLNRAIAAAGDGDASRVAVYLGDVVARLVAARGVDGAAAYLREHRREFRSDAGDYVWLYARDPKADSGFRFIYHDREAFDGQSAARAEEAMPHLFIKERERGLLSRVLAAGADEADARPEGGFVAYRWYSPQTHDIIAKRTHVRRVAEGVYVGSGHAVQCDDGADVPGVLIVLGGFMLLNGWWAGLGVSEALRPTVPGPALVYAGLCAVFAGLVWATRGAGDVRTYEEEVRMAQHVDSAALGLAGLAFSLSLFASNAGDTPPTPLIATAFLLLLPTVLQGRCGMSADVIKRSTQVKHMLVANCTCLLAAAVIAVGLKAA